MSDSRPPETNAVAVVRFTSPGFHHWPGATGQRAYLSQPHRHLFHVEARIEVYHDDREIEFHDFLEFCRLNFPSGNLGARSCETLARNLAGAISTTYQDRTVSVSVFEDGEVGAVVTIDGRSQ